MTSPPAAPAPGTRPRNRRELIIRAAAELFYRTGYAAVSMGDIAAAVNVQPSALYRHFSSKSVLFLATAKASLAPTAEVLQAAEGDVLRQLARVSLATREVGVLWQRESRLLPDEVRDEVRADLRGAARELSGYLLRDRDDLKPVDADLLSWAVLAAMSSVSFHHLELPQDAYETLLADMLERITRARLPEQAGASAVLVPGLEPRTRREQLLREAGRLFADKGFAAVTMAEIGEASGMAGASVYNHFESKHELLTAVLDRSNEWLWMELDNAFADSADAAGALDRLLDSYLRLAMRRPDLVTFLTSDLRQLPDAYRKRMRQSQHDYISEWTELLRSIRPDLDATGARIQIQAALMIVSNCAQTPHLTRLPAFTEALRAVATTLLH